ncbi:NPCBM/NEW2 domain-containing protein [Streptomyces sp. NPDC089919]|uniref:NPCBM/NEW2 domain-containing protein n=1 Tax=Streptomyces sp. NPDC089919 TaxID=3155188 RepID=UPI0034375062
MQRHRTACALTALLATVGAAFALPATDAFARPAAATTGATAAAAGPYVLEAESMSLTNFTTEAVHHTWNGNTVDDVTYAKGVAGQTSTARTTFGGAAGTYDLITRFNGKAANGTAYQLSVNSVVTDSWSTSQRYGRDYTDPMDIDTRTTGKVALAPGDVIELKAVSNGEVPRVDRITVQQYVGAPTSALTINSPNSTLNDGFNWGKDRALGMTFYPGNPMMGHEPEWWRLQNPAHPTVQPGYWGAYTNRESYYNRDISHQSDGAHALGLDTQTFSMMKTFAADADDPGQNGWPLWAHSSSGAMYYIDGTGFRELPSPFNLMTKAFKQYQWTGDPKWINDPDLAAFYDSTMGPFLASHEVKWDDANPANDQPVSRKQSGEYTATFFEFPNENLVSAADSLGYQYQSMLAYAEILKAKGDTAGGAKWTDRAKRVRDHFEAKWWDAQNNRYYRGKDAAGTGYSSWGHEASFLMMLTGLGDQGPRTSGYLDFIAANDDDLNVEATSYLPEMYYQYNRSAEGWAWLKKLMTGRNTYPEVSFLAVSSVVDGMMGVQPDAPHHAVATVSRLTPEAPWVEIDHLKVGDSDLKLKHTGTTASTLTNNSGSTVNWEGQFYGNPTTITVNGTPQTPRTKRLYGRTVSYVTVPVAAGTSVTATATGGGEQSAALSDLNWSSARADFGTVQKDRSVDGNPIRLNGTAYAKGIGTHANSTVTYPLGGSYTRFTSDIGVDDEVSANGTVGFEVWGDGVRLYQSPVMTPTSPTQSLDLDVTGVKSLVLKVTDTGDGINSDHADWAGAELVGTPPTPTALSALDWTGTPTTGWGTVQKDRSVGGNPIKLNGTGYADGIGTHANSTVTYALGGAYTRFTSDIGVDDEVSANATVGFEVWGDGVRLYQSPVMTPTSPTQSLDLDVTGVKSLVLKVTDTGDGINSDHADWAGARLTK